MFHIASGSSPTLAVAEWKRAVSKSSLIRGRNVGCMWISCILALEIWRDCVFHSLRFWWELVCTEFDNSSQSICCTDILYHEWSAWPRALLATAGSRILLGKVRSLLRFHTESKTTLHPNWGWPACSSENSRDLCVFVSFAVLQKMVPCM